jgi:hypothetical protein
LDIERNGRGNFFKPQGEIFNYFVEGGMMLKKTIRNIHIAMGVGALVLPSLCAADWNWLTFEGEEKPWSVNVGTRVWFNEWETNTRNANLTTTLILKKY